MKIASIALNNFRIYEGENKISFTPFTDKNINLIAGKNGYGKTTFLTALVWAFYGKLMAEVEEKYRSDIAGFGGYEKFQNTLISRSLLKKKASSLFVEVVIQDVLIPSIPCENLTIKRQIDFSPVKETLTILIDGMENELTKEVGFDLFINDFVLPREIAKFFFFDAEKIVSLAEAKSKNELKALSRAYSEVLGIKKYEDLKKNLEHLSSKLKRLGVAGSNKIKLESLVSEELELDKLILLNEEKQKRLNDDIDNNKVISTQLQEKLIKEGNGISLEELNLLKEEQSEYIKNGKEIKSRLNDLMELLPFAIASNRLADTRQQLLLEKEIKRKNSVPQHLEDKVSTILDKSLSELKHTGITKQQQDALKTTFSKNIKQEIDKDPKVAEKLLLNFTDEQFSKFESLFQYINGGYKDQLAAIQNDGKRNKKLLSRLNQKIKQAEVRKNNPLAIKYREEKEQIDAQILKLINEISGLEYEIIELNKNRNTKRKLISELEKNTQIQIKEKKKFDVTQALLEKVSTMIIKVKEQKRFALQNSLNFELTELMHKENFVSDVLVRIEDEYMDIDLLDQERNLINKDTLSKGEQQLYASALLKALVDQSGIEFPIFIDSPLQKFDKEHSLKILEHFYPNISNQVVLFPLLEKEISIKEMETLKPQINKSYSILHKGHSSYFSENKIEQLNIKKQNYVHAN